MSKPNYLMIKIRHILSLLFLLLFIQAHAYQKRNLLQNEVSKQQLRLLLSTDLHWVPYPDYADRDAWDQLTFSFKDKLIGRGEAALDYE